MPSSRGRVWLMAWLIRRGVAASGRARREDHAFVPGVRPGDLHPRRRGQGGVAVPGGDARRLGAAQRRRAAGRDEEQRLPRRRGRRGHARRQGRVRVQGHAVGSQHGPGGRRQRPADGGRRQAAAAGGGPQGQGRGRGRAPGADEGPPPPDAHGPQAGQRQLPRAAAARQGRARVHARGQGRLGGEDTGHAVHRDSARQRQHAHQLHARQPGHRGGRERQDGLAAHERRPAGKVDERQFAGRNGCPTGNTVVTAHHAKARTTSS